MNVKIGTEAPIFLFWEYLFRNFGILSFQCTCYKSNLTKNNVNTTLYISTCVNGSQKSLKSAFPWQFGTNGKNFHGKSRGILTNIVKQKREELSTGLGCMIMGWMIPGTYHPRGVSYNHSMDVRSTKKKFETVGAQNLWLNWAYMTYSYAVE